MRSSHDPCAHTHSLEGTLVMGSNSCHLVQVFALPAPLANSTIVSTLSVHCKWEDETVKERTALIC